jgi:hypothetical protein
MRLHQICINVSHELTNSKSCENIQLYAKTKEYFKYDMTVAKVT